jgi:hypothetical protein
MIFLRSHTVELADGDTEILNTITGKSVGKLRKIIGKHGLALIRLSQIDNKNMAVTDKLHRPIKVKVELPKFWQLDEALLNELKQAKL